MTKFYDAGHVELSIGGRKIDLTKLDADAVDTAARVLSRPTPTTIASATLVDAAAEHLIREVAAAAQVPPAVIVTPELRDAIRESLARHMRESLDHRPIFVSPGVPSLITEPPRMIDAFLQLVGPDNEPVGRKLGPFPMPLDDVPIEELPKLRERRSIFDPLPLDIEPPERDDTMRFRVDVQPPRIQLMPYLSMVIPFDFEDERLAAKLARANRRRAARRYKRHRHAHAKARRRGRA